jgi:CheY-like chemotaxis protein
MPSDIERGRAAGFSEYLTKPLEVQRVLDVMDRLLWAPGARQAS